MEWGRSVSNQGVFFAGQRRTVGVGGGEMNEVRKSSGVAVSRSHGEESCWREGRKVVEGESDPVTDCASQKCCDDGPDGPIGRGSNLSAETWIGHSDSECSGSERKESASKA